MWKSSWMNFVLVGVALLFVCGCGGSDGSSSEDDSDLSDIESGGESLTPAPVVVTEIFGQDGNLWKPSGDSHGAGAGNLVVLLSSKYTEQFDSCEVALNTGEVSQLICINDQPWTHTPFSCFSNGERQTWRAVFPCSDAAEVKVTCYSATEEVIFTVPETSRGWTCQRFG